MSKCPVCDGNDPKCRWRYNPADCSKCNRAYRSVITDDQIKHMVNRFLMWKLPENFAPDNGISFEPEFNKEYMAAQGKPPMRRNPVGTNLLDYTQAEAMVRHMIAGMP